MKRLLGLDTEYGIFVAGAEVTDLVDEARTLVQSWPGAWAGPWDYSQEHPLRDLRGFRADHLQADPQDAKFERPPSKPMSRNEERADRVLPNGARLYQDHGHPEYATPECRSIFDLVAHDKAGERIVMQCAKRYQEKTGKRVSLYKNNVDFHGMSYGAHENYLMRRDLSFAALQATLLPFLITRILFAGSGKVSIEGTWKKTAKFQLSQRADFFSEICSVDTLHRRPILNTRDEPHTDRDRFRRLHVISGDANLCQVATALKVGATALVLDLLESEWTPPLTPNNPVQAIKDLSRNFETPLTLSDGKTISAIDLQRHYLAEANARFSGRDPETDWILNEWTSVLDDLSGDPTRLRDRVDWAAKQALLFEFLMAEEIDWNKADPELLQSLDLAYHDIDPESGLFMGLSQQGEVRTVVDEGAIQTALKQGPLDTRAFARGWCVQHLKDKISAITWSRIVFNHEGQQVVLPLGDLVDDQAIEFNELVQRPGMVLDALIKKAN